MAVETLDRGARGVYHSNNKLNELTNKEWLKFTKSWFVHNPPPRKSSEILHPAKYPESLIKEFIEFFTKKGAYVLDPFLGTGSTLVACDQSGRNGIGIELSEKYARIAEGRTQQKVIIGNSADIDKIWHDNKLPQADFIITSPPYGPMLNKKGLVQQEREEKSLDTKYSENKDDLGNIQDYDAFVNELVSVFKNAKKFLKNNGYVVVILQNYTDGRQWRPLAWDFGKGMGRYFTLKGERIWCQDNKTLYPYGYRYSYVTNVHHHYCLIFKKEDEP